MAKTVAELQEQLKQTDISLAHFKGMYPDYDPIKDYDEHATVNISSEMKKVNDERDKINLEKEGILKEVIRLDLDNKQKAEFETQIKEFEQRIFDLDKQYSQLSIQSIELEQKKDFSNKAKEKETILSEIATLQNNNSNKSNQTSAPQPKPKNEVSLTNDKINFLDKLESWSTQYSKNNDYKFSLSRDGISLLNEENNTTINIEPHKLTISGNSTDKDVTTLCKLYLQGIKDQNIHDHSITANSEEFAEKIEKEFKKQLKEMGSENDTINIMVNDKPYQSNTKKEDSTKMDTFKKGTVPKDESENESEEDNPNKPKISMHRK